MTSSSKPSDPAVPIGSEIVRALKLAGPLSANALARRLKLRKATVLAACGALAAVDHIRRLGKRWTLRPSLRCAGLTTAGKQCRRNSTIGTTFCAQHQAAENAVQPVPHIVAPFVPKPFAANARVAAELQPPDSGAVNVQVQSRDQTPTPQEPEFDPDRWRAPSGRRITEADVIQALSMLGDEEVQAYREGRLAKTKAYAIARHRLRMIGRRF